MEPAPVGAPEGIAKALRLNYSTNGGQPNASVGCVQSLFSKPINITLNRPISATVFGDGSAAVLDVQLCTAGGTTCVHYFVAVNHTGWRTVAYLPLPEAPRFVRSHAALLCEPRPRCVPMRCQYAKTLKPVWN